MTVRHKANDGTVDVVQQSDLAGVVTHCCCLLLANRILNKPFVMQGNGKNKISIGNYRLLSGFEAFIFLEAESPAIKIYRMSLAFSRGILWF